MSGRLPAITPDSFKAHLRAEQCLADAAAGKAELANNDPAKINRMTAFLAGGSMTVHFAYTHWSHPHNEF